MLPETRAYLHDIDQATVVIDHCSHKGRKCLRNDLAILVRLQRHGAPNLM
jgi:hypothetical protein